MRGKGEGSVFRRKDGRWCASLTLPGGRRKAIYGSSRVEVVRKLTAATRLRDHNRALPDERITTAAYLESWLASIEPTVRATTWLRYRQLLRRHAVPAIGHVRLSKLDPIHVQQLYSDRLRSGLSPTTVRQLHAVLHRALKQAERWSLVPRNVSDLVDPPRRVHQEMKVLNAQEVRLLLDASRGTRFEAMFVVAITTGLRQGELLALCWRNVDLDRGYLSVVASLQRSAGAIQVVEPKTTRSRRQVALTGAAIAALRSHRARQKGDRLRAGAEWIELDLVFPNLIGRPLDAHNMVRRDFYGLLRRLDLPRIRFHDLRHTAATLMLSQGVHPKVVAEMLGHSTVAVTLDVYSHVTMTLQREAAHQLDDILRQ